jgi:hypothetical protein
VPAPQQAALAGKRITQIVAPSDVIDWAWVNVPEPVTLCTSTGVGLHHSGPQSNGPEVDPSPKEPAMFAPQHAEPPELTTTQ